MRKTIKKTLFSLNPSEYPNVEVEFQVFSSPLEMLKEATEKPFIYAQKNVPVKARYARAGEVVDTRPRVLYDGKRYVFSEMTKEVESETDDDGSRFVIITNPDGEQHLQPEAKTREKYYVGRLSFDQSLAKPKGNVVTFRRVKENACISNNDDCWFVTKGGCISADPEDCYPITNAAFEDSYTQIKKK